jgi:hypothetical protein
MHDDLIAQHKLDRHGLSLRTRRGALLIPVHFILEFFSRSKSMHEKNLRPVDETATRRRETADAAAGAATWFGAFG